MTKILYVIDSLVIAGAQVHLVRLANDVSDALEVRIVCLGPVSQSLVAQLSPAVGVERLRMASIRDLHFLPSFAALVRLIREWRPDIVHTYLNTANVFGALAAKAGGVGRIVTSRRDMGAFRSPRIGALEALISRRMADRVFCVCEAVARRTQAVERIPASRIRVLYNGVRLSEITERHRERLDGPIRFGIMASMNRLEKGHAEFLTAAGLVAERRPGRARFVLVGDGPFKARLLKQSSEPGLGEVTTFAGELADTNEALALIDVLVVPSHTEGISNAAIEAMAAGLPVVATAVDGNLEVVRDGETGYLVPVGDAEALARRLVAYVDDPSLLGLHGRNGRIRCGAVFDRALIRKQYLEAYREAVGGDWP